MASLETDGPLRVNTSSKELSILVSEDFLTVISAEKTKETGFGMQ